MKPFAWLFGVISIHIAELAYRLTPNVDEHEFGWRFGRAMANIYQWGARTNCLIDKKYNFNWWKDCTPGS